MKVNSWLIHKWMAFYNHFDLIIKDLEYVSPGRKRHKDDMRMTGLLCSIRPLKPPSTQDLEETNHPILDKITLHISKQLDDVGIKLACRVDIAGSAFASKTPTILPSRQQNHFVGDVVPVQDW